MAQFFCSHFTTPSTSMSKFIADQPLLTLLETKCSTMNDLKKIHSQLIKTGLVHDAFAASRLLAFSATTSGDINYAYLLFTRIKEKNLFTWNTIIRSFAQSSTPQNAISLFIDMLLFSPIQPHRLTYPSLFKAYAQLGCAQDGAQLHGRVVKSGLEFDPFVRNTMIYMYASCGFCLEAKRLFDEDNDINFDVVSWNSMIMGLGKNGEIDESRRLFNKMQSRNGISWNSMISGYVRNGNYKEAFELFNKMQEERIQPSEFTIVSLLNASARLGAIKQGEWIHDYYVTKNNHVEKTNVIVSTAIIDMYSKCGCIEKAKRFFKTIPKKGLSCYNSMILGLATNSGYEEESIQLFSSLESCNYLKPDSISFIGVLTACNHSGLVQKARHYFSLMTQTYSIVPSIKHYTCLVDLLGRAGLVKEAEEIISNMVIDPDVILWGSLLSACKKHRNVETAEKAVKRMVELDESDSSSYVLMANVYSGYDRFEEAMCQRVLMKENMIEKEPGCSSIEVDGEVHEFVADGRRHPQMEMIYSLLNGVEDS